MKPSISEVARLGELLSIFQTALDRDHQATLRCEARKLLELRDAISACSTGKAVEAAMSRISRIEAAKAGAPWEVAELLDKAIDHACVYLAKALVDAIRVPPVNEFQKDFGEKVPTARRECIPLAPGWPTKSDAAE